MTAADSPVALCAALADETRWQILCALGERAASASELARRMPVSRQAVAHHVAILVAAGLAEPAREGKHVRYRALGWRITHLAEHLETIGRGWEQRLDRFAAAAEGRAAAGERAVAG